MTFLQKKIETSQAGSGFLNLISMKKINDFKGSCLKILITKILQKNFQNNCGRYADVNKIHIKPLL